MYSEPAHARKTISYYSHVESFFPVACVIVDNNTSYGSGFLIAPDLILTNYHVYKEIIEETGDADLANCKIRFLGGEDNIYREVKLHPSWNWIEENGQLVDAVPLRENPLDYIIFRLATKVDNDNVILRGKIAHSESIMTDRRWICLFDEKAVSSPEVKVGASIYVVHHPATSVEFEAVGGWVDRLAGPKIFYSFDHRNPTQGGSSGALCVLADDWRVVALHQFHIGRNGLGIEEKCGISITRIIEDLEKKLPLEKLNYLKIRPELARTYSVPEDHDKGHVQELVDLLEPFMRDVYEERRYTSYLLALPPSIDPQSISLFRIISHLDNIGHLHGSEKCPILDFLVILEKLCKKDLLSEPKIWKWVKKTLVDEDISVLVSSSRARSDEYFKKRTVNISVDIKQSNDSNPSKIVYAPVVSIGLMGKPKVCISEAGDFLGIKSRNEFVQKLQDFWSKKINNILLELDPKIVQIDFGVNGDTLGWDIGRSELSLRNDRGSYSFRIGEKYPFAYRSLEREGFDPHIKALKENLNSQYQVLMFGIDERIPVLSKYLSKGQFHNVFHSAIVKDRKIICIYSFKQLSRSQRQIIYNSILNMGIPAFIWCASKERAFDIASFQDFTSLDDFRNWLSVIQMDDRKYFDVLFDDPLHLLKFRDEGV